MVETLRMLVDQFGYIAVAIGCFFEGETALLLGTLASHQGILTFPGILLAGLIGGFLGDQFWFYLGRYLGKPFIERRPSWQKRAAYAKHHLDRHGAWFIISVRFFYGLRSITPFVMGATRVSRAKFLVCDALSCLIWVSVMALVLIALGSAIEQGIDALQSEKGIATLTVGGITLFAVVALLLFWRARVNQRVEDEET